ncbi:Transient receptor potential cation channel subfamily M member [Dirofilaria immitis]|nr:Transient receptor potential cation channel subfamily M member [Dirofilaria immitis]
MQDCASVSNTEFILRPDDSNDGYSSDERQRTSSINSFCCTAPRNSISGQQFYSITNVPNNYYAMENVKQKRSSKLFDRPELFVYALTEKLKGPWIEQRRDVRSLLQINEVALMITAAGMKESVKCGCGLSLNAHSPAVISQFRATLTEDEAISSNQSIHWNIAEHTKTAHTDAFGTLEFSGGAHAHKAHYVRLGYDSDPSDIMYLMEKIWGLEPPRLVITVHGGITNFEVQEKLGQVFREGLLKAAQTTGAWIITAGIDAGVVRHVATALDEAGISARMRSKVVTIGIAPWGLLKRHEKLIGKDIVVSYDPHSFSSKSKYATLNDRHSYFLLVDNGTNGRYGADIILRKRFEEFIARKQTIGLGTRHVPVICAVLEGGTCTIRAILQYLTNQPPVPVIVCDGSGRASDLIAFAHRHILENGNLPREIREQLLNLIGSVFRYSSTPVEQILEEILCCAKHRDLLTVFRLSENKKQDVDHAILIAILKGQNLSAADQLALTLVWNRVDIARSDIFIANQNWNPHLLYNAMMEALALDRVDFVKLLLENGVSMKKFLTISRLEQLYNMEQDSILPLINDSMSIVDGRITLPKIGIVIERLMGNAYKCSYTSRKFKNNEVRAFILILDHIIRQDCSIDSIIRQDCSIDSIIRQDCSIDSKTIDIKYKIEVKSSTRKRLRKESKEGQPLFIKFRTNTVIRIIGIQTPRRSIFSDDFQFPFNDLMLWAVLSRRQEMARCMWTYGEEGMAKALAAIRLYKSMSKEAADEYIEVEVSNELREFAEEFKRESLSLLNHCYMQDDAGTLRLLTAELPNWGHHTCLSLALSNFVGRLMAWWSRHQKEKEDDDHSQNSACSSFYASERANLIDETLRIKSGARESRKSIGANLQEMAQETSWTTKFSIFYSAPITTFWIWLTSYFIFLSVYTYVILIEFPVKPTGVEWFLFAYVIAFAMEHFRKLLVQEASTICEKIHVYFDRCWNYLTWLAIITFFIGFAFRCNQLTRHSYGRVILSCNIVFWYIKLLDFMGVHPRLGPYIQMTGKMIVNMMYILALLLVTLMSFGISRQAITNPHEKWQWVLIVFLVAGYPSSNDHLPLSSKYSFDQHANRYFQRYEQLHRRNEGRRQDTSKWAGFFDFSMKLSLNDDELRLLHDFEEDCMDDLSRKKSLSQTLQQRLCRLAITLVQKNVSCKMNKEVAISDSLQVRLNDMVNKDCNMKSFLREIESKLYIIEKNQQAMLKLLQNSIDNEGNSENLPNTEVVRKNDRSVMEKKALTGKRELFGIYANLSNSDEEKKNCTVQMNFQKMSTRLRKDLYFHWNILTEKKHGLEVLSFRRSFILRDEVYTSITDTIKMPKVMHAPDGSVRTAASPNVLATQFSDAAIKNLDEVSSCTTGRGIQERNIQQSVWSITDLVDICRSREQLSESANSDMDETIICTSPRVELED